MEPLRSPRAHLGEAAGLPDFSSLSNLSSESLLFVLGALPLPLVWFRLDDGQVVFLNRAFREVFGYQASEVLSWSHWSSRFPNTAQREQAVRQWYAQTRKRKTKDAGAGLPVEEMEISVLARDGSERTVLHSGAVLPAINCALAIYVDITRRKQDELRLIEAEHAAREREVLYPILLGHTHEMIIISSSDGTRRFVSPAVFAITAAPLDREHLMLQADKALYRAKAQGRNTFSVEHCGSVAEAPAPGRRDTTQLV